MFAQHALIRRPSSRLADGIVTHLERSPVDVEKARTQWQAYVDALHAADYRIADAAAALGMSTGRFNKELAKSPALWQKINQERTKRNLPPLRQ